MPKSSLSINGVRHHIDSWIKEDFDHNIYKINFQVWSDNHKASPKSFSARLSREFIEDEIDNDLNKDYIEQVAHEMIRFHVVEILAFSEGRNSQNIKRWMVEAKNRLKNK